MLLVFRILLACQLSLGLSATPQVLAGGGPRILSFLFSLLGQPPSRNAPPTWQPGAGIWERSGRGLLARGAGLLHRVRPSTHPARPGCPPRATPPGSGRHSSPRPASENLEAGGARLGPGMQRWLLPGSQLAEWGRA